MKLKFKHQPFQSDAAHAVCEVFAGQPYATHRYLMDKGAAANAQQQTEADIHFTGWSNARIALPDAAVLDNVRRVQRTNGLRTDGQLDGRYNLTVEMETGTGKTYTYIKTMLELNKRYGWSKFIVVVPSVAIREGVFKSFQITGEHFAEDYNRRIRYFIYNSKNLTEIERFASSEAVNVMIINAQAFNAKGKDARRIDMELDTFRSRRPIDVLAKTNPILIIDEPQSVEGPATQAGLKKFNPLFTLRYSATHKEGREYNMVYRLDALDAYNKKLVKKIAVKGITQLGSSATGGYLYLESINLFRDKPPSATIEFDCKGAHSIRKRRQTVTEGFNIYEHSGDKSGDKLDEYREGWTVVRIDGRDNSVELRNGKKIHAGEMIGAVDEGQLRRIQIRETILSHLEKERRLFPHGIKVLSLFFIDAVAKYRAYDDNDEGKPGEYAHIFEEEYRAILQGWQTEFGEGDYQRYLSGISAEKTHAGYFSVDKNKKTGASRFVESKKARGSDESEDADAYDLIMKNKELLLSREEPVRFIFSHSALREGWDNPNVFQICTLKTSGSDVRKRQEVGRGLRLCVNQHGERMDAQVLQNAVHDLNVLTVVANESYDAFCTSLQKEMAEALADRPRKVDVMLFVGKVWSNATTGAGGVIDQEAAQEIYEALITQGYVKKGELTEKYHAAKAAGVVELPAESLPPGVEARHVAAILDTVYDPSAHRPENGKGTEVPVRLNKDKLESAEFKKLWEQINRKSAYTVSFDSEELIRKAVAELNQKLEVTKILFVVQGGELQKIESKATLAAGGAMSMTATKSHVANVASGATVKYDLIGRIVTETGLTRATVAAILKQMAAPRFAQFKDNPEDFIIKASRLIRETLATVIVEHITYNPLKETYGMEIFTEPGLKGSPANTMAARRHLYDHVLFDSDSKTERDFAAQLEAAKDEVAVYIKLPRGFFISTPVGKYSPDWAVAFYEGKVKHIYFVAETKGDMATLQLRGIEAAKITCALKHFTAISSKNVRYDVVDSYAALLGKVMK